MVSPYAEAGKKMKVAFGYVKDMAKFAPKVGFKGMAEAYKVASNEKAKETMENMGKAFAKSDKLKKATDFFKQMKLVGQIAMAPFNAMLSIMEMFGVAQPLLDIISGVVQIIGGAMLGEMADSIRDFAEVLFSPEMIEIWQDIGAAIGEFLSKILDSVTALLKNPIFQRAIKNFIVLIMKIAEIFMTVINMIVMAIGDLSASEFGALVYGLLVAFAFMKGLAIGGMNYYGLALATLFAGLTAAVLSPLLSLQHGGIVTRDTLALVHKNEAMVPLDDERAGTMLGDISNDELLWATEDVGRRLDMLIMETRKRNKIERLRYL